MPTRQKLILKSRENKYFEKKSEANKTIVTRLILIGRELFCSNYKSTLPSRQRVFVNYCRLVFAALISALIFQYFLKNMMLSTGVSGVGLLLDNIIQLHSNVSNKYLSNVILYLLFFGLNIPFFIYAIKQKIKKKFIFNTFIFLMIMLIWGLFLPQPSTQSSFFHWITSIHKSVENAIIFNLNNSDSQTYNFIWEMVLLAVSASFLKALCLFIIYGSSATSGGTDFIAFKYAISKRQNFAFLIGIFNILIIVIVLFFSYLFDNRYDYRHHENIFAFYTSFKTIATFIYVVIFTIIINIIYPINQKLYIAIISRRSIDDFYRYFIHNPESDYSHSFTIIQSPGLLNNLSKKQHTFITISTIFELDLLKNHIKKLDKRAFVYIIKVNKILGKYNEVLK